MTFKKGDYSLFIPQTHGKYREKNNNILCYNETFKKTTPTIPSVLAAFFSLTLIVLSNTIQTPFKNDFQKGDYSLFIPQTHGKYREKIIIFFAIMKPLSGALKTPIKT
ncbi:hypothetical protein BTM495_13840 [Helicobacter pylori]